MRVIAPRQASRPVITYFGRAKLQPKVRKLTGIDDVIFQKQVGEALQRAPDRLREGEAKLD